MVEFVFLKMASNMYNGYLARLLTGKVTVLTFFANERRE